MLGNTFGNVLTLTTYGESHGIAIGGVLEGLPAGIIIDIEKIQQEVNKRKPGQSSITTSRKEEDIVHLLSGIFNGHTTGMPIAFMVYNQDHQSKDYDTIKDIYRPSHADYTYQQKYGIRDHKGGGRSSARETVSRVIAGAITMQWLHTTGIEIHSYVSQVGHIQLHTAPEVLDFSVIESNAIRCPDTAIASKMIEYIQQIKAEGDTIGGIVSTYITGVPTGLGEPVFQKLNAALAAAMLSINAAKGFDIGIGMEGLEKKGSQWNDAFYIKDEQIHTHTNNSGGIQGGISNGEPIYFRTAFKAVSTIFQPQTTITTQSQEVEYTPQGRHDPCVLPRAVPIVKAMAALVIADFYLLQKTQNKS